MDFGPLTLSHWHQALRTSKSSTMCGTDNWCIPGLKLLPDSLASILLDIYNSVETSGISWPVQLSNWLLVVLRKTECDTPDWTLLRPISVAGILYRLWARMRTVDCMRHCKSFRTPLVAPNLSTRAIWYFLSDYLDQQYTLGRRPCGVVLDIIKRFNILSRDVVYDIMVTLGFPERVLGAWFRPCPGPSWWTEQCSGNFPHLLGSQKETLLPLLQCFVSLWLSSSILSRRSLKLWSALMQTIGKLFA